MIKAILSLPLVVAAAYGSVSDIEILWTLIAVVGMVYSLINFRESWLDWKLLRKIRGYDARRIVACSAMQAEGIRAAIQGFYITIGVYAMFIPETPTAHLPLRYVIFGALFRWGFVISSLLLTYKSYLGARLRKKVYNHYNFANSLSSESSAQEDRALELPDSNGSSH